MIRRARFESIADLPERYQQQAMKQAEKAAARRTPRATTRGKRPPIYRPCSHDRCHNRNWACTLPQRFELVFPGRAITTNSYISALFIRDPGTRAARQAEVGRRYKEWKQAAFAVAVHDRIPTLQWATFQVQAVYLGRLPDAGGLVIVGKAILDGLVEAGVFANDTPDHVLGEYYPAPVEDQAGDRVVVTVQSYDRPGRVGLALT